MFVSRLEGFNLFVTLVTKCFSFGNGFFLGVGKGETKSKRQKEEDQHP
jgi:hypothetical protein